MADSTSRGRVTVYGTDVRKPPLIDSAEPQMIVIKDGFGDPMILMLRMMSDDTWGMVTRSDADWLPMLVRCGLADVKKGVSFKEAINDGLTDEVIQKG